MIYTCEMCDTEEKATRRKDNIFVCDRCDNKYPIDHIKLGFEKSLEIGKEKEKHIANTLKKHFYGIYDNDDYKFDLVFINNGKYITMEVKYDDMCLDTGNFAVEFESRGKESGIKTTESDFWAFVDKKNKIYLLYTSMMKKLCVGKKEIQTRCEDSYNKVYLISSKEIKANSVSKDFFINILGDK